MRMRLPADNPELEKMLSAEGLALDQMAFAEYPTWVLEKDGKPAGFFTVVPMDGRPHLQHFCVSSGMRDHAKFRAMIRVFKAVVRWMGFIKATTHVFTRNEWLVRFIKRYFGVEPYAEKDGRTFFLLEV